MPLASQMRKLNSEEVKPPQNPWSYRNVFGFCFKSKYKTREMVLLLRVLAALPEDMSLISSTYTMTQPFLKESRGIWHPLLSPKGIAYTWCTDIHAGNTTIYKNNLKKFRAARTFLRLNPLESFPTWCCLEQPRNSPGRRNFFHFILRLGKAR